MEARLKERRFVESCLITMIMVGSTIAWCFALDSDKKFGNET